MPAAVRALTTSSAMKWLQRQLGVITSDVEFSGSSLAALAGQHAYPDASGAYVQAREGTLTCVRSATISYDLPRAATLWDETERLVGLRAGDEVVPRP